MPELGEIFEPFHRPYTQLCLLVNMVKYMYRQNEIFLSLREIIMLIQHINSILATFKRSSRFPDQNQTMLKCSKTFNIKNNVCSSVPQRPISNKIWSGLASSRMRAG